MLIASPKATVPVLICNTKTIIDESMEIMRWALNRNDPEKWLQASRNNAINTLIEHNDSQFKIHLDHYKYADRFPDYPALVYRARGETFLKQLEHCLTQNNFLISDSISLADTALFPFIRQFASVDSTWFAASPYPKLRNWLNFWLNSNLFHSVMKKQPVWNKQQKSILL